MFIKSTFYLQLILAIGNYMNEGNERVGQAAGFKIKFLAQVGLLGSSLVPHCNVIFIAVFMGRSRGASECLDPLENHQLLYVSFEILV